jgi:hypothetical protein
MTVAPKPADVIERFRLSGNVYCIGSFERGVTVLHQQNRALNLAYALEELQGPTPLAEPYVIIGGGISGITCAAALALLGHRVLVLEKGDVLVPMQDGCTTRWLHPYIYDWPKAGYERRSAELPFLRWHAGAAGDVARRMRAEFETIRRRAEDSLTVAYNAEVNRLDRSASRLVYTEVARGAAQKAEVKFAALILAVGFGSENTPTGRGVPYWQNDNLHQADPYESGTERCLVSGCGDGGFIDLQRAILRNYRQDTIVDVLLPPRDSTLLIQKLRGIREERTKPVERQPRWLYDRFTELADDPQLKGELDGLAARLRSLARNGAGKKDQFRFALGGTQQDFQGAISNAKCSLFNAFVTFAMWKANFFEYIESPTVKPAPRGKGYVVSSTSGRNSRFDRIVERHGTQRSLKKVFASLGFDAEQTEPLRHLGRRTPSAAVTNEQVWPPGWWSQHDVLKRLEDGSPLARVEFAYERTVALASMFTDVAGHAMAAYLRTGSGKVRVAIHRLLAWDSETYYQQLGPYGGTRNNADADERKFRSGRIFPVHDMMTGRCILLGRPLIARDVQMHVKDHEDLGVRSPHANKIDPNVQEILAWPLLSTAWGEPRTIMAVFADSTEAGFFRPEVYHAIRLMVNGFIENVESLLDRHVRPVSTSFEGVAHDQGVLNQLPPSIQVVPDDQSNFSRQNKFGSLRYFDFVSMEGEGLD